MVDTPTTSIFRQRWRDSQTSESRPGQLIRQPRWIDHGLVALGVLLVAGAVAASTVIVDGESLITVFLPRFW